MNKYVIINDSVNRIIERSKNINKIKHARSRFDNTKPVLVSVLGSMYPSDDIQKVFSTLGSKLNTEKSMLVVDAKTLLNAVGLAGKLDPEDFVLSTNDLKRGYVEIISKDNKLFYFSLNTGEFFEGDTPDDEETREELPDMIKEAYSVVEDDVIYLEFLNR